MSPRDRLQIWRGKLSRTLRCLTTHSPAANTAFAAAAVGDDVDYSYRLLFFLEGRDATAYSDLDSGSCCPIFRTPRLGKPVEVIYIPDRTHILEKPWDRMISEQGHVD